MNDPLPAGVTVRSPEPALVSYTHWMYALHALSAFIGIVSSATVVAQFVFGIPSIIAIVMNYVKGGDARGTWLESHFTWQRRTFWFALLWVSIVFVLSLPLFLILIGFLTFGIGVLLIGLWVVYRVARGWLRLRDGQPIAV
jgi:uncharacterized membrane protein